MSGPGAGAGSVKLSGQSELGQASYGWSAQPRATNMYMLMPAAMTSAVITLSDSLHRGSTRLPQVREQALPT